MKDETVYSNYILFCEEKKDLLTLLIGSNTHLGERFKVLHLTLEYFYKKLLNNEQISEEIDIFTLAFEFLIINFELVEGFLQNNLKTNTFNLDDINKYNNPLSLVLHIIDFYQSAIDDESKSPKLRNFFKRNSSFFQSIYDKTRKNGELLNDEDIEKFTVLVQTVEIDLNYNPILLNDVFTELSIKLNLHDDKDESCCQSSTGCCGNCH